MMDGRLEEAEKHVLHLEGNENSAALLQRATPHQAHGVNAPEALEEEESDEEDEKSASSGFRRRRRSDATYTYTTTTTTTPWWAKDVDDRLEVMKTELAQVAKHVQRLEGQENSAALLQHGTNHEVQAGSITEALDKEEADEGEKSVAVSGGFRRRRRSQRTRPLTIDTDPTPPYVPPLDDRLDTIEVELEEVEQRIQQLEGQ